MLHEMCDGPPIMQTCYTLDNRPRTPSSTGDVFQGQKGGLRSITPDASIGRGKHEKFTGLTIDIRSVISPGNRDIIPSKR